ncbi:hypothetical protein J2Y58_003719 [Sphingomonas sp. BE138]|uniref:hypothetical protein n=1 Tax=Sphingomonas sp. BE138 TaxID=2817845 RepID=UPI00285A58AF|nr:hypothetical protein [Sphingomonas sp. BE138]MDR6790339.1 hypothetical protein [Sphingomonas sp. BE138]
MSQPVADRGSIDAASFAAEIVTAYRPVVLRGQAAAWPAVEAARRSDEALVD